MFNLFELKMGINKFNIFELKFGHFEKRGFLIFRKALILRAFLRIFEKGKKGIKTNLGFLIYLN